MDEQLKPIEESSVPSSGFTSIKEEKPLEEVKPINTTNVSNDEILRKLPEWNLEPPVEINRGK